MSSSKTPVSRRGLSSLIDEARDASNSKADWGKLTLKVLRLKCNWYNIPITGTKTELIDRLVDHFDRQSDADAPGPSNNDDHNGDHDDHDDGGSDIDMEDYPPTDPYDEGDTSQPSDDDDRLSIGAGSISDLDSEISNS